MRKPRIVIAFAAVSIVAAPAPATADRGSPPSGSPSGTPPAKPHPQPSCAWVVVSKAPQRTDPGGRVVYLVRERNTCTGEIREYLSY